MNSINSPPNNIKNNITFAMRDKVLGIKNPTIKSKIYKEK